MKKWLMTSALVIGATCSLAADPQPAPLRPVPTLDLNRYMGVWHEVAKYPNRFQRDCISNTSAQYQFLSDGSVQVTNRCRQADGSFKEAIGQARRVGQGQTATLEVRFAPAWLSWLPWVWGTYWVIDLDPAYQLVAVSEPEREYLWILSRSPVVDPQAYEALVKRLVQNGFDAARLQPSPAP